MQCAVVEFARNVCGWTDAQSAEINPTTKNPVVIDMPEHNQGQMGGTMRLGKRQTIFNTKDSVLCRYSVLCTYSKALRERSHKLPGLFCVPDATYSSVHNWQVYDLSTLGCQTAADLLDLISACT